MNPQATASSDSLIIEQYLRDRTIGCPKCGYNLRGLTGNACPECGQRLLLQLNTVGIHQKWWLIRLLSVAFPLGFVGTLAAAAGFGAWRSTFWTRYDWWTLGALCAVTLLYTLLLVGVIYGRTRFLTRSHLEQRIRAIGLLIIMVGLQLTMFYFFRRYTRYY